MYTNPHNPAPVVPLPAGQLRRTMRQLAGTTNATGVVVRGVVKSVDRDLSTCVVTPDNGQADYLDVHYRATTAAGTGLLLEPAVDSAVRILIEDPNTGTAQVVGWSDLARVYIETGPHTLDIDADEDAIVFNGGQLGSFIVIGDLVAQLNTLEQQVNDLLAYLNDTLVAYLQTHTHTSAAPGSPTSPPVVPPTPPSLSPLVETQISDIENLAIQH